MDMESSIKFNPDLESEGGKLYRQYCEEKGIDYSITAGANFCLGYMAVKPNQGPVWVKVSDFKYEIGMPYHAKDSRFKGAGHFNSNGAFIWGDCTVTHPKDQDELYILDESGAGREEDNAVEFAEYCKMLPYRFIRGIGWEHHVTKEISTTAELYELFKQQNEK